MKREYLLMTTKHSEDTSHPLFWGEYTKDSEKRSFGGYTGNPLLAERYSLDEILMHFAGPASTLLGYPDFPIDMLGGKLRLYDAATWENHRNHDDVFAVKESEVPLF